MVLNFSFFFFIGTKQVNHLSHSSLLNCSRWLCAKHFRNILGHFCSPCMSHHRDLELTLRFFKIDVIYSHDVSLQSNADSWGSTSIFLGFCSVLDRNGFLSGTAQLLVSGIKWFIFYFIAASFVNVFHKTCSISCPSPILISAGFIETENFLKKQTVVYSVSLFWLFSSIYDGDFYFTC